MRIDFRNNTVDGRPVPPEMMPRGRVFNADTGERIAACKMVDDETGEYVCLLPDSPGHKAGRARLRIELFKPWHPEAIPLLPSQIDEDYLASLRRQKRDWQQRAEAAEAEVARLQALVESLAARVTAQSGILTRRAEKA